MQNPSEKKPFPWVWVLVGCGVISICALVFVAVAFFSFALPAVRTVLANQNPVINVIPPAITKRVPELTPLPTLPASPTAVPSTGSGNGTTNGNLPFKFSAIQDMATFSGQSLLDEMTTALSLNNDSDFMAPKTYTGTVTLDPSTSFTVGNAWCAKDAATLQQNLKDMQFQLSINGTPVDLSKYPTISFSDQKGDACAMTGIAITPSGTLSGTYHVVLTQKYLKQLDDGITSSPYPAGDVTFDFKVNFHSGNNNGSNT
jgi:hypothetical protein